MSVALARRRSEQHRGSADIVTSSPTPFYSMVTFVYMSQHVFKRIARAAQRSEYLKTKRGEFISSSDFSPTAEEG